MPPTRVLHGRAVILLFVLTVFLAGGAQVLEGASSLRPVAHGRVPIVPGLRGGAGRIFTLTTLRGRGFVPDSTVTIRCVALCARKGGGRVGQDGTFKSQALNQLQLKLGMSFAVKVVKPGWIGYYQRWEVVVPHPRPLHTVSQLCLLPKGREEPYPCHVVQPPTHTLAAPTNLKAGTVTATSIPVTWTASKESGVSYVVYLGSAKEATTTGTSYTFRKLTCGTQYILGVVAVNRSGKTSQKTLTSATTASCGPPVTFVGTPGTGAPPSTLGPYTMHAFGKDPSAEGNYVNEIQGPTGPIELAIVLEHAVIGSFWPTWSNGYGGDVYVMQPGGDYGVTISLPPDTGAFYLYLEPGTFAMAMGATSDNGTDSGSVNVYGNAGARYFGFYARCGTSISSITVSGDSLYSWAVGEFGIAEAAGCS